MTEVRNSSSRATERKCVKICKNVLIFRDRFYNF